PQDSDHVAAILLVADTLRAAFGPGWLVRPQGPVALDDRSEPEPDVSVVQGSPRDYREGHPVRPVLVVEVSKTRLAFDRARKATLYARNGVRTTGSSTSSIAFLRSTGSPLAAVARATALSARSAPASP